MPYHSFSRGVVVAVDVVVVVVVVVVVLLLLLLVVVVVVAVVVVVLLLVLVVVVVVVAVAVAGTPCGILSDATVMQVFCVFFSEAVEYESGFTTLSVHECRRPAMRPAQVRQPT